MLEKLKKGDIAYYVAYKIQTQCKITKVSDEYINAIIIDEYGHKISLKFRKNGLEKVDSGNIGKLYYSGAEYLEQKKEEVLKKEINKKLKDKTYSCFLLTEILILLTK